MAVKEIVEELKGKTVYCEVNGEPNEGKILKLDLQINQAFVKLKNKIKKVESESVPNAFANSEDDYHFEKRIIETDEVWLSIKD